MAEFDRAVELLEEALNFSILTKKDETVAHAIAKGQLRYLLTEYELVPRNTK